MCKRSQLAAAISSSTIAQPKQQTLITQRGERRKNMVKANSVTTANTCGRDQCAKNRFERFLKGEAVVGTTRRHQAQRKHMISMMMTSFVRLCSSNNSRQRY